MVNNVETSSGFQQALGGLAEAIASRKIEPICTSYLALRREARGMKVAELLDRVDKASENGARSVIISAFSHRRCYMCEDGTTTCQSCKGTGASGGSACSQCDGLGVETCSFCMGRGWSDRGETPAEIREAVLKRQIAHLEKGIQRLAKVGRNSWESASQLPAERKTELASWLVRLHARLTDVAQSISSNGDDRAARYGALAGQVDKLIAALRVESDYNLSDEDV